MHGYFQFADSLDWEGDEEKVSRVQLYPHIPMMSYIPILSFRQYIGYELGSQWHERSINMFSVFTSMAAEVTFACLKNGFSSIRTRRQHHHAETMKSTK